MRVVFPALVPTAAAAHHIELLPQDPPFLQRGGGLCDNRVLQGHHRLAQAEGRKHAQNEHTHCTRKGVVFICTGCDARLWPQGAQLSNDTPIAIFAIQLP